MKKKADYLSRGFSMIEALIAALILAIGAVTISKMTISIVNGNKKSQYYSIGINLASLLLEELKSAPVSDLSTMACSVSTVAECVSAPSQMYLYQDKDINPNGYTWQDQFDIDKTDSSSPCNGLSTMPLNTTSSACATSLRSKGPYIFLRSYAVFLAKTLSTINSANVPCETYVGSVPGAIKPETEPDCRVNSASSATRTKWLACTAEDQTFLSSMSIGSQSLFLVKVLVSWRERDGSCSSVHLQNTISKEG